MEEEEEEEEEGEGMCDEDLTIASRAVSRCRWAESRGAYCDI